ncbi:hypothetical protein LTS18_013408, partial [Coniosporium uncinatum]
SPENFNLPMYHTGHNDDVFDDGIFLPGSTYQELHTTLRRGFFHAARSNAATRHTTPDRVTEIERPVIRHETMNLDYGSSISTPGQVTDRHDASSTPNNIELTQQEEYELWKNYINEVAPWIDKFDNQCTFGHKLPPLAKHHGHLRYAILALSARQLERKDHLDSTRSLALYQEAIHLLLPLLQTKQTAVIASCVVLCVLEMMSCAPQEWRRHLDGCANLIEAVGITGIVGGIEQALFWAFARMDVCGGLISDDRTLIPLSKWGSGLGLANDVRLMREAGSFDMYANLAVYLLGQAVGLFADYEDARQQELATFQASRWAELYEHIEDWYEYRPAEMRSILQVSPTEGDFSRPFPILLFGNPPAISGNQLYHTAALLMLQKRPPGARYRRKPKSILWHARRICAISISNTHHGCRTNGIQPLWVAGRVMSSPAEHKAILELYETIEMETGWGAKWRAEDLKEFWGDLDD